jgi:hypothetical protein
MSDVIFGCSKRTSDASLIEEISSFSSPGTPEYSISVVDGAESSPRRLVVKINLPGVTRMQDCLLDVSDVRKCQNDYE